MPIQILMPALSPTMTEGNLVKWSKKEGDVVKAGQVIAEIETDKATMEVEAVDEGILGKILVDEGTEGVKVNTLIALLLEEGEDAKALEGFTAPAKSTSAPSQQTESVKSELTAQTQQNSGPAQPAAQINSNDRVIASPLAKRIAQQNNIDLSGVNGSGPRGRVVKVDVEAALSQGPSSSAHKPQQLPSITGPSPYTDIKLNNMRKVIASRLSESKQNIPHFYLTIDCQLDRLIDLRQQINTTDTSRKLSINDFVLKACALSIRKHPGVNSSWQGSFVRQFDRVDLAMAVAIDGGLITPIIRGADQKSLIQVSEEAKTLAEKARNGKLVPEEYQDGTFSLSNLGMFGISHFGAIINPPQACILAVGSGEKRPVIVENEIRIATVMTCTLSLDHRVVDGALGAEFLSSFKKYIENPLSLLI